MRVLKAQLPKTEFSLSDFSINIIQSGQKAVSLFVTTRKGYTMLEIYYESNLLILL